MIIIISNAIVGYDIQSLNRAPRESLDALICSLQWRNRLPCCLLNWSGCYRGNDTRIYINKYLYRIPYTTTRTRKI